MTDIIGTREAMEILGYTDPSTISRQVQLGRLPTVSRLPGATGAYLFDRAEIERIAAERAS